VLAAFTVLLFVLIALAIGFEIKRSASITEVALVALTLCYVVVSAAQWDALERNMAMTRRASDLTLRAWLVVSLIRNLDVAAGQPISLAIEFTNVGGLPAKDIRGWSRVIVQPVPVEWPESWGDFPVEHERLVVGGKLTGHLTIGPHTLPDDDVASVLSGNALLIVAAMWSYTDAIGTVGTTKLCAYWRPHTQSFVVSPNGNDVA